MIRAAQGFTFAICMLASAQVGDDDFLDTEDGNMTLVGPLAASLDDFTRVVSFDFSPAFFRRRNLDADQRSVLLNGVLMNRMNDGRAEWSNWGGLNDALRNQERTEGLAPSGIHMGKLGGTLNMNSLAGMYSSGLKVSLAASNRSYRSRMMATYVSPWSENGWKWNVSASGRWADEGYREGTPYQALSCLLSMDRKVKERHYFNATLIFAHNLRGMSGAMTREVYELKGHRFNSYWGYQQGKKRSSRLNRVFEPIFQLNYAWLSHPEFRLGAHLTVQKGFSGRTRLDYGGSRRIGALGSVIGGGANPDPTYYQKLPSYFLRWEDSPDYAGAFLAGKRLEEFGQLDWSDLYASNADTRGPGHSVYVLYEDRTDDTRMDLQLDFSARMTPNLEISGALSGKALVSHRYARVLDLLGGNGYLDVDPFDPNPEEAQSDLRNPNRIVLENQPFRYNYEIRARGLRTYLRLDHNGKRYNGFLAGGLEARNYERHGHYENGSYPGEASFGKGRAMSFFTYSLKAGINYKLNGRHWIQAYAAFLQEPPAIRDSYYNVRESHDWVVGLRPRTASAVEFNYEFRMPRLWGRLAAYLNRTGSGSKISFYYADGLTGLEGSGTSSFVHEIMTGIGLIYQGAEFSLGYSLTDQLELTGVASLGSAKFAGDPSLYLTSDELKSPVFYGPSGLTGYRIANGPQNAASLGFRYSDPNYWWVGATMNWFRDSYVSVAPVTRTRNFFTDPDGLVNPMYEEPIARKLLRQEKLPGFSLLNLTGGKSWKLRDNYLGVFCSINNVLNALYTSGGYEQSRNANYESLLEDRSREMPLFSPKYWYGYGTTFFASVYARIK